MRTKDGSDFNGVGDEHKTAATPTDCVSEYENSREQRIKENQERMQKLGHFDLSKKLVALKSATGKVSKQRSLLSCSTLPYQSPIRRSSRLKNILPVNYCELHSKSLIDKENGFGLRNLFMAEGVKPEIYTEEDEKMLGSTEMI